jgi:hypothetical protein
MSGFTPGTLMSCVINGPGVKLELVDDVARCFSMAAVVR